MFQGLSSIGRIPSFQILNLQTRVRFPVALPVTFLDLVCCLHFSWSLVASLTRCRTEGTVVLWRTQIRADKRLPREGWSESRSACILRRQRFAYHVRMRKSLIPKSEQWRPSSCDVWRRV